MTLEPTQAGGVVTYEALPGRVVFGVGALDRLAEELARLGAERVLLVASKRVADDLAERLGDRHAATFGEIVQHVPVEVAQRARRLAGEVDADSMVAVGGGSAVGLAKAVALGLELPIVAVPSTYAGSELTTIYGLSQGGRKQTGRDPRVLPKVVLYDPALTVSLPPEVTGPSGMNALAHCVEAFYGPGANPVSTALAQEGIRALAAGLPAAVERPDDLEGRTRTVRFVAPAVPEAMARVAAALGAADAASGCFRLARQVGAPASLAALGLAGSDLDRAAELCAAHLTGRPRPARKEELRALLGAAHDGQPPGKATAAP
jgi:maleylacetate reductase